MPGTGFKVADAYADFHIDVDSEIGRAAARLKAKGAEFARMGENAGKAFSAGFGRGVDLDKGFTKEVEKLRTRTNQIQRMGGQAGEGYARGFRNGVNLRGAMVEQLAVVRSSRAAFGREGKQAGDAYARGFGGHRLSGPSVGGSTTGAEAAGEAQAKAMARGIDRGGRDVETAARKNADRINAQFSALKFLALSQGLPAAAAAGVGATAGIIGGAAALFVGLGVAGAHGAEQVSNSWIDTANVVQHGITALSAGYEGPLVNASEMVRKAFVQSTGQIERGMTNAAGAVESLTGSAISLGQNALPGVVVASGRLGPVLSGVNSLLGNVGTGFSEMAVNASEGNEGARRGLVILGDTLRTTEARVGTIAANFANASAGPLNSFRYTLDQVTGALVDASAQGSAVNGFLGGFTTSTSGAITVARGLFSAINALPPQVAQLGGAVSATSMILSRVGIDGGKGFEGLGAKVRAAGKDLEGTEKFAAKAGTAVGGLAAGALNPAALAVGALSLGLLVLGDSQEKAAAAAAEHRENVRQLTDAIRADNGALGEHTATNIANALASKNASNNLNIAGVAMGSATVAAMGNAKAMRDVTQQSNQWIQGLADQGIIAQKNANGLKGINQGLLENGGTYEDVAQKVAGFNESLASLHPELQRQLQALLNGTGAIGEQAKATREAYAGYLLQEQGLTGLTEAQIKARDATTEHTKAIYDQQNAELGYRGAVQSTKEAQDAYNKIVKDGKQNTDEGARALLALENAMSQQEQAAYNAAYASSTATTENGKLKDATTALNRETVNLANGFTGPLPASLQNTISRMGVTEAKAAGLKVGVNKLGEAVYTLPNGKEIKLEANSQQAKDAIADVQRQINALRDKTVTLTINQTTTYSGTSRGPTGSLTGSARFSATGGPLARAPIRKLAGGGLVDARAFMVDVRAGGRVPGSGGGRQDNILARTSMGLAALSRGEWVTPEARVNQLSLPLLQAVQQGNVGVLAAANEALAAARKGTRIEEDLSFAGQSANGRAFNDQLAQMMYAQTHADAGAKDFQAAVASWLPTFVAQQTAAIRNIATQLAAAPQKPTQINVTPPATMDYDLLASIVARKLYVMGR